MKELSSQALYFDLLLCMVAICYSGQITVVPANEQTIIEKRTGTEFQSDIIFQKLRTSLVR